MHLWHSSRAVPPWALGRKCGDGLGSKPSEGPSLPVDRLDCFSGVLHSRYPAINKTLISTNAPPGPARYGALSLRSKSWD